MTLKLMCLTCDSHSTSRTLSLAARAASFNDSRNIGGPSILAKDASFISDKSTSKRPEIKTNHNEKRLIVHQEQIRWTTNVFWVQY